MSNDPIANYTLALVFVGAIQVVAMIVQAYFLYGALSAAQQAAKANTDTVKVALEGQRAQLIVNVACPIVGCDVGQIPRAQFHLKNVGPTTGYRASYETWIEVVSLPFVDFTPAADYYPAPHEMAVYPHDLVPIRITIELKHPLSVREAVDISQHKTHGLCFRIRLSWTDAFRQPHWANFGYYFDGSRVGSLPKYNDAG